MTNRPPPAKASTIVLYRLTPSPQLYMLKRSARSSFMPNALVFPGGRVERLMKTESGIRSRTGTVMMQRTPSILTRKQMPQL